MKRLTRSSRRSTDDAMVTSFGQGERSTRSRTSSDNLIISELPKATRSRKHSSADKRSDLSKDTAGKRRHVSGGSKHRTRSQSGSDLRATEPSTRVSKGNNSNVSLHGVTKDSQQGKNEKVQSEVILSSGDAHTPKRSTKSTNERLTKPKETIAKSIENISGNDNDSAALKVSSSPSSSAKRSRNNSGNNVTVKHSKLEDKYSKKEDKHLNSEDKREAAAPQKVPLNTLLSIETNVKEDSSAVATSIGSDSGLVHLPVNDPKVTNDSNVGSKIERTDKVDISCSGPAASSNQPSFGQSLSGNVNVSAKEKLVSPTRRMSPRKGPLGEDPVGAASPLAKALNPLVMSMQADSKEEEEKKDTIETAKRKLEDGEQAMGNGRPVDAPSEQRRKRHRSSSRNLTTEFDNSLKSLSGTTVVESSASNSGKLITTEHSKKVKALSKENTSVADVPTREVMSTNNTSRGGASSGTLSNADRSGSPAVNKSEVVVSQSSKEEEDSVLVTACNKETQPLTNSETGSNQRLLSDVMHSGSKQLETLAASTKEVHSVIDKVTDITGTTVPKIHNKASNSVDLPSVKASIDKPGPSSQSSYEAHLAGPSTENFMHKETLKPNVEIVDPDIILMERKVKQLKEKHSEMDVGYDAMDWSQEVNEGEPFYFESDHLALKGNKDYRMLLRTLTTLEAQRKQATLDLECLVNRQKQALSDPIGFVHKIQHKADLALPTTQRVVPLPEVSWETYLGKPENSELLLTAANQKIKTRPSKSASVNNHHNCLCCKKIGSQSCQKLDNHTASTSATPSSSGTNSAKVKAESKSETFNQPWTLEEQRKLEELLVKYPMEAVEARRWEKIAQDLGNRTPLQVASRVQKYFIKLTRAGLPVPGRLPHSVHVAGSKRNRRTYPFMRPVQSTFLQSVLPPVYMNDKDSWDSMDMDSYYDDEPSDDEGIPPEMRDSEEYKELRKLKHLKREKIRQQSQMTHSGFQCDSCGVEPIVGTRWHCSDCPSGTSTDLCQKCMDRDDYKSIVHSGSHHLEPIRFKMEATYVDNDYTRFQQQHIPYNYLDPNYTPEDQPTL